MVKAYLRYIQENIFGALTSNQANVVISKAMPHNQPQFTNGKALKLVVSACNEVVSLSNLTTGEVVFKLFEEEALHGFITCLATSGFFLAVGYSSGTIVVYNLE